MPVKELLAWLCRRRTRIRVVGQSMEPTLREGEFLIVCRKRQPEVGDIVVGSHPSEGVTIVKRLHQRTSSGYVVTSDNSVGSDSTNWGPMPGLEGVVTVVLNRPTASLKPTAQPQEN